MDVGSGGAAPCVGGDPLFADNLFRFGDTDGAGSSALLQHPLAVALLPSGQVAVADSYNHRVKLLDPASNRIRTVAGSGQAGVQDGTGTSSRLSEPGGLAVGPGGQLYIAGCGVVGVKCWPVSLGEIAAAAVKIGDVGTWRIMRYRAKNLKNG